MHYRKYTLYQLINTFQKNLVKNNRLKNNAYTQSIKLNVYDSKLFMTKYNIILEPFRNITTLMKNNTNNNDALKLKLEIPTKKVIDSYNKYDKEKVKKYIGAIDQGTTSTRFIIFDKYGNQVLSHQSLLKNIYPQPGWQEQNPYDIQESVRICVEHVMRVIDPTDIICIGITNQRETLVVWDKYTSKPLYNAIVWSDLRTSKNCDEQKNLFDNSSISSKCVQERTGLPISTYFTAIKLYWLLQNNKLINEQIIKGTAIVGTVDSWLLWNLLQSTKDIDGKIKRKHITDITNASRTMLFNINTKNWDDDILNIQNIPRKVLPNICSNSEIYGYINEGPLQGIPISGCLGDQQASLLGQLCIEPGSAKSTYGTGCFILKNTGTKIVNSKNGLLTTVAFQLGTNSPVYYALEGSVSTAGAAVTWLQNSLEIIKSPEDLTKLANSVDTTGGIYFVPALSGLLSPYWCPTARGIIIGITQYTTKAHICRALIEAIAFQTYDVLKAMELDSDTKIHTLKVDGGLTRSTILCQFQSNILNIPVYKPNMDERTALGAAFAAGLADGINIWENTDELIHMTTSNEYKYVYYVQSLEENLSMLSSTSTPQSTSINIIRMQKFFTPNTTTINKDMSINEKKCEVNNDDMPSSYSDIITNTNSSDKTEIYYQSPCIKDLITDNVKPNDHEGNLRSVIADELKRVLQKEEEFILFSPDPSFDRESSIHGWKRALQRSLHWEESG